MQITSSSKYLYRTIQKEALLLLNQGTHVSYPPSSLPVSPPVPCPLFHPVPSTLVLYPRASTHPVYSSRSPGPSQNVAVIYSVVIKVYIDIFLCLSYLKDDGLVILLKIKGENIGVHQSLAALAKDINCLLKELNLDP